jgi:hypothetical protein
MRDKDKDRSRTRRSPERTRGILSDIRCFFLHKPSLPTLIKFTSLAERQDYSQRILQRLGIDVDEYSILNIHRIGIEAPVRYVFEELLVWDGQSPCWPNHVARLKRTSKSLEEIRVFFLGGMRRILGALQRLFGPDTGVLFRLNAMQFRHHPGPSDFDNARYLLFKCSGGYPVGILTIYVRSPIAEQNEREQTQLFFAVGFNYYGQKNWPLTRFVNRLWESVHNRVTANVLNRYKQLCEARFEEMQEELKGPPVATGGPEVRQPTFSEIDLA